MQFPQPLARGVLVRRYKRFFAEVRLDDGTEVIAHCPNPGSMLGMNQPGLPAWLSTAAKTKRKLPQTLELLEVDGALVGVNTLLPNRIVAEALAEGAIPELAGYDEHRREVDFGDASRADFLLLAADRPPCFVEVKSVTLRRSDRLAEFPDSVTGRGLRHLAELTREVRAGMRAVILFLVQRGDCDAFAAAADIDPAYAEGLAAAARAGVEVLCYDCDISPSSLRLNRRLPWRAGAAQ
jgi:sugar fermentation stimulation protein A